MLEDIVLQLETHEGKIIALQDGSVSLLQCCKLACKLLVLLLY